MVEESTVWLPISIFGLGVLIFYWLFYSPRLLGWIVSILLRWLALPKDSYFSVASLSFGVLQGRIFFRDVRFYNRDMSVRLVDGYITIWWWMRRPSLISDSAIGGKESNKGMVSAKVFGLEVLIFNQVDRYNAIRKLAEHRGGGGTSGDGSAPCNVVVPEVEKVVRDSLPKGIPKMFSLLGNFGLVVENGCVMAGNKMLHSMAVLHFDSAHCVLSAEPSPLDLYTTVIRATVDVLKVFVRSNKDFTSKEVNDTLDERAETKLGWSTFFKGLFMNKKQLGAQIEKLGEQKRQGRSKDRVSAKVPAGRPASEQTNKDESVHPSQEDTASFRDPLKLHAQIFEQNRMLDLNSDSSSDIVVEGVDDERTGDRHHTGVPSQEASEMEDASPPTVEPPGGLERVDFASVTRLCITYTYDNINPAQLDDPNAPPPRNDIHLEFHGTIFRYGPQQDAVRLELQDFFLPFTFEDLEMPSTSTAMYRRYKDTLIRLSFDSLATVLIEYRDMQPVNPHKQTADTVFMYFSEKSHVALRIPLEPSATDRYPWRVSVAYCFYDLDIITPVNNASFLKSSKLTGKVFMTSPEILHSVEGVSTEVQANLYDTYVWFLADHIDLLSSLGMDWTSYWVEEPVSNFVVRRIGVRLKIHGYHLMAHVNSNNIIDHPNSLEENAFIEVSGSLLSVHASIPNMAPRSPTNDVQLKLAVSKGRGELLLPSTDPLYRGIFPTAAMHIVSGPQRSWPIISFEDMAVFVQYSYHTNHAPVSDPPKRDCLSLEFAASGVTGVLTGFSLVYIFNLVYNYFGQWRAFVTSEEFAAHNCVNRKARQREERRKAVAQEWAESVRRASVDSRPLLYSTPKWNLGRMTRKVLRYSHGSFGKSWNVPDSYIPPMRHVADSEPSSSEVRSRAGPSPATLVLLPSSPSQGSAATVTRAPLGRDLRAQNHSAFSPSSPYSPIPQQEGEPNNLSSRTLIELDTPDMEVEQRPRENEFEEEEEEDEDDDDEEAVTEGFSEDDEEESRMNLRALPYRRPEQKSVQQSERVRGAAVRILNDSAMACESGSASSARSRDLFDPLSGFSEDSAFPALSVPGAPPHPSLGTKSRSLRDISTLADISMEIPPHPTPLSLGGEGSGAGADGLLSEGIAVSMGERFPSSGHRDSIRSASATSDYYPVEAYSVLEGNSGPPIPAAPLDMEIVVTMKLTAVSVDLPAEMFAQTEDVTGNVRCKVFSLECRNDAQNLCLDLSATPITLTPPNILPDSDTFLGVDGMTFSMVSRVNRDGIKYYVHQSINVGSITGELDPASLAFFSTVMQNFIFLWDVPLQGDFTPSKESATNMVPVRNAYAFGTWTREEANDVTDEDLRWEAGGEESQVPSHIHKRHVSDSFSFQVHSVVLHLWEKHSLLELSLEEGLSLTGDATTTLLYHSKLVAQLPHLRLRHLVRMSESRDERMWCEGGVLETALRLSLFSRQAIPGACGDILVRESMLRDMEIQDILLEGDPENEPPDDFLAPAMPYDWEAPCKKDKGVPANLQQFHHFMDVVEGGADDDSSAPGSRDSIPMVRGASQSKSGDMVSATAPSAAGALSGVSPGMRSEPDDGFAPRDISGGFCPRTSSVSVGGEAESAVGIARGLSTVEGRPTLQTTSGEVAHHSDRTNKPQSPTGMSAKSNDTFCVIPSLDTLGGQAPSSKPTEMPSLQGGRESEDMHTASVHSSPGSFSHRSSCAESSWEAANITESDRIQGPDDTASSLFSFHSASVDEEIDVDSNSFVYEGDLLSPESDGSEFAGEEGGEPSSLSVRHRSAGAAHTLGSSDDISSCSSIAETVSAHSSPSSLVRFNLPLDPGQGDLSGNLRAMDEDREVELVVGWASQPARFSPPLPLGEICLLPAEEDSDSEAKHPFRSPETPRSVDRARLPWLESPHAEVPAGSQQPQASLADPMVVVEDFENLEDSNDRFYVQAYPDNPFLNAFDEANSLRSDPLSMRCYQRFLARSEFAAESLNADPFSSSKTKYTSSGAYSHHRRSGFFSSSPFERGSSSFREIYQWESNGDNGISRPLHEENFLARDREVLLQDQYPSDTDTVTVDFLGPICVRLTPSTIEHATQVAAKWQPPLTLKMLLDSIERLHPFPKRKYDNEADSHDFPASKTFRLAVAIQRIDLETIQTAIPRIPCGLFDQPCSTRILCRLYNLLFIGSVTQSPTSSVSCERQKKILSDSSGIFSCSGVEAFIQRLSRATPAHKDDATESSSRDRHGHRYRSSSPRRNRNFGSTSSSRGHSHRRSGSFGSARSSGSGHGSGKSALRNRYGVPTKSKNTQNFPLFAHCVVQPVEVEWCFRASKDESLWKEGERRYRSQVPVAAGDGSGQSVAGAVTFSVSPVNASIIREAPLVILAIADVWKMAISRMSRVVSGKNCKLDFQRARIIHWLQTRELSRLQIPSAHLNPHDLCVALRFAELSVQDRRRLFDALLQIPSLDERLTCSLNSVLLRDVASISSVTGVTSGAEGQNAPPSPETPPHESPSSPASIGSSRIQGASLLEVAQDTLHPKTCISADFRGSIDSISVYLYDSKRCGSQDDSHMFESAFTAEKLILKSKLQHSFLREHSRDPIDSGMGVFRQGRAEDAGGQSVYNRAQRKVGTLYETTLNAYLHTLDLRLRATPGTLKTCLRLFKAMDHPELFLSCVKPTNLRRVSDAGRFGEVRRGVPRREDPTIPPRPSANAPPGAEQSRRRSRDGDAGASRRRASAVGGESSGSRGSRRALSPSSSANAVDVVASTTTTGARLEKTSRRSSLLWKSAKNVRPLGSLLGPTARRVRTRRRHSIPRNEENSASVSGTGAAAGRAVLLAEIWDPVAFTRDRERLQGDADLEEWYHFSISVSTCVDNVLVEACVQEGGSVVLQVYELDCVVSRHRDDTKDGFFRRQLSDEGAESEEPQVLVFAHIHVNMVQLDYGKQAPDEMLQDQEDLRELLELWDADSDYQWRSAKKSVPLFAVNFKDLNVESSVYRKPRMMNLSRVEEQERSRSRTLQLSCSLVGPRTHVPSLRCWKESFVRFSKFLDSWAFNEDAIIGALAQTLSAERPVAPSPTGFSEESPRHPSDHPLRAREVSGASSHSGGTASSRGRTVSNDPATSNADPPTTIVKVVPGSLGETWKYWDFHVSVLIEGSKGEIFLTDNLLLAPKLGYLCLIGTFHGATCSGDVCFSCRRTTFNFCRLNAEGGPSSDRNMGTASSDDVTPLSPAPDFGSDSGERNPNQGSRGLVHTFKFPDLEAAALCALETVLVHREGPGLSTSSSSSPSSSSYSSSESSGASESESVQSSEEIYDGDVAEASQRGAGVTSREFGQGLRISKHGFFSGNIPSSTNALPTTPRSMHSHRGEPPLPESSPSGVRGGRVRRKRSKISNIFNVKSFVRFSAFENFMEKDIQSALITMYADLMSNIDEFSGAVSNWTDLPNKESTEGEGVSADQRPHDAPKLEEPGQSAPLSQSRKRRDADGTALMEVPFGWRLNVDLRAIFEGIEVAISTFPVSLVASTGPMEITWGYRSDPLALTEEHAVKNFLQFSTRRVNGMRVVMMGDAFDSTPSRQGNQQGPSPVQSQPRERSRQMLMKGGVQLLIKNFSEVAMPGLTLTGRWKSRPGGGSSSHCGEDVFAVVDQSSLSQGDTMYRLHVLIDSPFVVLRPEAAYFLQYMSNHLMSRLKEVSSSIDVIHKKELTDEARQQILSVIEKTRGRASTSLKKGLSQLTVFHTLSIKSSSASFLFDDLNAKTGHQTPCHCAFVAIESISVSGEFNRKSSARGRSATLVGDSSVSGLEIYFPEEAFPDVAEFVPGLPWGKHNMPNNFVHLGSMTAKLFAKQKQGLVNAQVLIHSHGPEVCLDAMVVPIILSLTEEWTKSAVCCNVGYQMQELAGTEARLTVLESYLADFMAKNRAGFPAHHSAKARRSRFVLPSISGYLPLSAEEMRAKEEEGVADISSGAGSSHHTEASKPNSGSLLNLPVSLDVTFTLDHGHFSIYSLHEEFNTHRRRSSRPNTATENIRVDRESQRILLLTFPAVSVHSNYQTAAFVRARSYFDSSAMRFPYGAASDAADISDDASVTSSNIGSLGSRRSEPNGIEGSGRLSTLINVDCTDVDLSPVMMVFMEEMKTELRSRPKRRFGALAEGVSVRQHRVVKFDVRSFDLYTRTKYAQNMMRLLLKGVSVRRRFKRVRRLLQEIRSLFGMKFSIDSSMSDWQSSSLWRFFQDMRAIFFLEALQDAGPVSDPGVPPDVCSLPDTELGDAESSGGEKPKGAQTRLVDSLMAVNTTILLQVNSFTVTFSSAPDFEIYLGLCIGPRQDPLMQGRPIALQLAYTQGLRTRDEYLTILDILAPAISLQFVEYTTKRQPQYDFSRDRDSLCFGSVEVQGTKMHFFQHLLIGAQEIPSFFGGIWLHQVSSDLQLRFAEKFFKFIHLWKEKADHSQKIIEHIRLQQVANWQHPISMQASPIASGLSHGSLYPNALPQYGEREKEAASGFGTLLFKNRDGEYPCMFGLKYPMVVSLKIDDVSLSSDVLAAEGSRVLQLRSLTVRIRKDMASGVFLQDRDHAGSVCDVTLDHVSFFSSEEQKRGSSTFRSVLDARADVSRIGFRLQRYPLWLPVYERLGLNNAVFVIDSVKAEVHIHDRLCLDASLGQHILKLQDDVILLPSQLSFWRNLHELPTDSQSSYLWPRAVVISRHFDVTMCAKLFDLISLFRGLENSVLTARRDAFRIVEKIISSRRFSQREREQRFGMRESARFPRDFGTLRKVPSSVSLSERSGSSSSVPTSTSKPKPAKNRSLAELRYPFFDTGRMLEHLMVGASCGECVVDVKSFQVRVSPNIPSPLDPSYNIILQICQITSGVRLPFQEVGVEVDWDRISALQVTLEGLFLEEDKRQSQIPPKPIVGVPLAQLSLVAEHRLHAPVPITAWLTSEWPQAIFVTTDLTKLPRLVSQVGALVAAIKEQLKQSLPEDSTRFRDSRSGSSDTLMDRHPPRIGLGGGMAGSTSSQQSMGSAPSPLAETPQIHFKELSLDWQLSAFGKATSLLGSAVDYYCGKSQKKAVGKFVFLHLSEVLRQGMTALSSASALLDILEGQALVLNLRRRYEQKRKRTASSGWRKYVKGDIAGLLSRCQLLVKRDQQKKK